LFILLLPNSGFADANDRDVSAVKFLKVSPLDLNFAFSESEVFEFKTRENLENFWKENSRIVNTKAPNFPVDWENEILILVGWESIDDVVRLPSLSNQNIRKDILEFEFFLTKPCFGIITDVSPTAFLSIPKEKRK